MCSCLECTGETRPVYVCPTAWGEPARGYRLVAVRSSAWRKQRWRSAGHERAVGRASAALVGWEGCRRHSERGDLPARSPREDLTNHPKAGALETILNTRTLDRQARCRFRAAAAFFVRMGPRPRTPELLCRLVAPRSSVAKPASAFPLSSRPTPRNQVPHSGDLLVVLGGARGRGPSPHHKRHASRPRLRAQLHGPARAHRPHHMAWDKQNAKCVRLHLDLRREPGINLCAGGNPA